LTLLTYDRRVCRRVLQSQAFFAFFISSHLCQGNLAANVWLLSAIACLTEYPDVIPILFGDRSLGERRHAGLPFTVAYPRHRRLARDEQDPAVPQVHWQMARYVYRRHGAPRARTPVRCCTADPLVRVGHARA
jgi:hypothetical protein